MQSFLTGNTRQEANRSHRRGSGVRTLFAAMTMLIVQAGPTSVSPARAADDASGRKGGDSFVVSATVVASCGIDARRLLSQLKASATPGRVVCSRTYPEPMILAAQPSITLRRDAATGVTLLTVEF